MSEKRFTFYYERGNEFVIEDNGKRLSNKKVVDLLNEQQDTIFKLQDLCGKSDGENMKLQEENEQLREINKELGDDLHNCRLNKNIIREKLKLWQDVHKEYDIYSIKDFEELMRNDK